MDSIDDEFTVNSITLRSAHTGATLWTSPGGWTRSPTSTSTERVARLPAAVLAQRAVSAEVCFTAGRGGAAMDALRVEQRVAVGGVAVEDWRFDFGFVIPGSTNTMQNVIEAAEGEGAMIPVEVLRFFDGDRLLSQSFVRIYYED
ncbi:retinal rod rhodopsin-sensitive cGMP 3',5'-cyclic phosphodiesterase subunit delta [Zopfochytrium polystomum]|nr:retinal rod rhodopsin-sensitive cGMP 3',5'-cyclic phosphodiesterase subunit delta [Zopfochytrium polystomum]